MGRNGLISRNRAVNGSSAIPRRQSRPGNGFCCARRRKKDWPQDCLLVTFGLSHRLSSPRIAVAVEPYPNRWTHHVVVSRLEELDEELMDWLREAYDFAQNK